VVGVTQATNARSLRLPDRLGFMEEARFIDFGEPQVQRRWDPAAWRDAIR
jgi:RimJ/RimL family protein N-acetyltransferase